MLRWIAIVASLLMAWAIAVWWFGFQQDEGFLGEDPNASAVSDSKWDRVERPQPYAEASRGVDHVIERLDQAFADRLQTAARDIDRARDEVEALPREERYRFPAGPDAPLQKDAAAEYRTYLQRIEETYRERTADEGPAREKAEQFLSQQLDHAASPKQAEEWEQTRSLGEAALEAGSEDPIIRMFVGEMWRWVPDKGDEAQELLDETADELEAGGYPGILVLLARTSAWQQSQQAMSGGHPVKAREYLAFNAALEFLAEETDNPQGKFAWWLVYPVFTALDKTGQQAMCLGAADRMYQPYVLHMMAGTVYSDVAWEARGQGFARDVTEEGWETMGRLLPVAAQHYLRAWTLEPTSPVPPTAMISIAMAGGDDRWSPTDWFYVALRDCLDYQQAYDNYRYAITPRWGGSHLQQLAFARDCLETERWDTMVPAYSFRVLYEIQQEMGDERALGKLPGIIDIVDLYVNGLHKAKSGGGSVVVAEYSTNWAYAAALYAQNGRYEEAHALFEAYGDSMTQYDFNWARVKLPYLRGLCAAMTGPANKDVPALRKWVEEPLPTDVVPEDLDEPLAEVARLREVDDRDVVAPYWDDVAAILSQLQTYHRGEWVEFTLDETLPGLYLHADVSEVTDEGTLKCASYQGSGGCTLRAMAWFEPPIIIEGEFAGWAEQQQDHAFGVLNGSPSRAIYGQENLRGVMLTESRQHAFIYDDDFRRDRARWEKLGSTAWSTIDSEFHHLRLKMWPDRVQHDFNYANLGTDDQFDREVSGWVCFGGYRADEPNSGRMRNLRIRRLDYEPPPATTDLEERRVYWRRLDEIHPGDAVVLLNLGLLAHYAEDYEQAERLLHQSREINSLISGTPYYLGATFLQQGRFEEAVRELESAIRTTDIDRARSDLSWILSAAPEESLRNPQRALALAEEAYELDADDFHSLRALAGAHARLGDFDAAEKWITRAIEAVDHDDNVQDALVRYQQSIRAGEALVIAPAQ